MVDASPSAAPTSGSSQVSSSQSSEAQTGVENAPDTIPEWKKVKHKYKAMGEEYEVDYDELVKRAEKGHGAEKRLAQASKVEKEAKARLEKLKDPQAEDFEELIELIGFDKAKKFADKLVWEQIQWDEKSKDEQQRLIAQRRAEDAERQLQDIKSKAEESQKSQLQQQSMQVIDNEIKQVLDEGRKLGLSVADLPEVTELIIDEMLAYLEYVDQEEQAGRTVRSSPPSHADVLRKIQERYDIRSSAYTKRLSAEQLMKMLTKEQLSALRQQEIDQLYAPTRQGRSTPKAESDFQGRPKAQKVMRTEDFFKKMDEKYSGGR
jgi:DNA-binding ferritin-like protein (Dps family)